MSRLFDGLIVSGLLFGLLLSAAWAGFLGYGWNSHSSPPSRTDYRPRMYDQVQSPLRFASVTCTGLSVNRLQHCWAVAP
jgi:hypothetical protein